LRRPAAPFSTEAGQHEVENDEIGPLRPGDRHARLAVGSSDYLIAFPLEVILDGRYERRLVIDNEDLLH